MSDLVGRLERLGSGDVSDGLGMVGLPPLGLPGIHSISPGMRLIGPALTVAFGCHGSAEAARVDYFAHVRPGDVLVMGNRGQVDYSVWGGHRSVRAIGAGVVGALVDGAYRDVDEHRSLGFPVFGRASTVASGAAAGVVPIAVNEWIMIGDKRVWPGDLIFGDDSGVLVIPKAQAAAVVSAAETKQARDTTSH